MYYYIIYFENRDCVYENETLFFAKLWKNATQFCISYMKLCHTLVNATQFPMLVKIHFKNATQFHSKLLKSDTISVDFLEIRSHCFALTYENTSRATQFRF